jgi:hypothetical protein
MDGQLRQLLDKAQITARMCTKRFVHYILLIRMDASLLCRRFVHLALKIYCMECKIAFAGHVFVPSMRVGDDTFVRGVRLKQMYEQRVCLKCLVSLDKYACITLSKATRCD